MMKAIKFYPLYFNNINIYAVSCKEIFQQLLFFFFEGGGGVANCSIKHFHHNAMRVFDLVVNTA